MPLQWGTGKKGRLGQGTEEDCRFKPAPAKLPPGITRISAVACGQWHALALSITGQVLHTGYVKSAPAGITSDATSFALVAGLRDLVPGAAPTSVAAGDNACAVLLSAQDDVGGSIVTWGHSSGGLLGTTTASGKVETARRKPAVLDAVGDQVAAVDLGTVNGAAVTSSGHVWVWGDMSAGCLPGVKPSKAQRSAVTTSVPHPPVLAEGLAADGVVMRAVSAARSSHHGHMLGTDAQGRLWGWGSTYKGQLGIGEWDHGNDTVICTPTLVPPGQPEPQEGEGKGEGKEEGGEGGAAPPPAPFFVKPVCGGIHSAALDDAGRVWTWGCGSDGRLGHSDQLGHRYLYREGQPRPVTAMAVPRKGRAARQVPFAALDLVSSYKQTGMVARVVG